MPLIIAVVAIIVIFVVLHDNNKDNKRESANREKMMRKTNSSLERETLDRFLREGMTFDEAYDATINEMVKLGFDICIPKDAYGKKFGLNLPNQPINGETSWVSEPWKFDSDVVKDRRERIHGSNYYGPNDSQIYNNFPKTAFEYKMDLKRSTLHCQTIEKGEFIIYPGYGTCEILDYNYSPSGTSGTYKVRVVKTGEIVNTIKIGDSRIRHMNDNFWN